MNITDPKILDIIKELIDSNIACTLDQNTKLGYFWDLNLQAKSHMYLFVRDDKMWVDMRYDTIEQIDDMDDLKYLAKQGMHGRDFISSAWSDFLKLPNRNY